MRVTLIAKPGQSNTGVGRYAAMLHSTLHAAGHRVVRIAPSLPPLPQATYAALRRLRMDLRAFLLNYPVWASYPVADVYHLTSQNLASLLLLRPPPGRVVVTVHDILPYMLRRHPRLRSYRTSADALFDRMAMAGLRRAHRLIADSHYTKRCIVEHLGIAPEQIEVIHLGIDQQRFRPLPVPETIRERYLLPAGQRYLIYVGSEDPRKNLPLLLRALAVVRRARPDVTLIKVGRAHFDQERQRLHALADRLGVRSAVRFLDDVAEDDLPLLYNLAEVKVLPSLYEGFGFPALEAMACGTPVVCARAASLPELVGAAALTFRPDADDGGELAAAILSLLTDEQRRRALGAAGLAQADAFRWERCAHQVIDIYADGRNIAQNASTIVGGEQRGRA